ncbi:glycosyltransferase family 2 protein [Streptococcus sobrinus]|uniref:glycosyltransferase family 2 protein n=4 Tax=Streptococcus sobrinus TaxID=1310 RepID=UPI0002EE53FF|nr:glycosyltransferase family 2 protein [Streptococcus sobrinus]
MKVNILMSTYNGERFLAQQLDSILAQSYKDWTLLIRDDGSSDRTPEIIAEYVQRDPRLVFINPDQRENLGVVKNFYTLLKYQEADFYFFCDQDDVWLPEKLGLQLEKLLSDSPSIPKMVYMDLKVVDANLNVISDSMIKGQSHHANTQLIQELTENTVTGGVSGINHALAKLWQTTDKIIMHDWYLALLATAFGKLVYIDKPGELYRQHDNNVLGARTLSKRFKKWLHPHLLFNKYWELIKASQKQASLLLKLPISDADRSCIEAFVNILDEPFRERFYLLKKYRLRKNKKFHTIVFLTLIVTKFAYKE